MMHTFVLLCFAFLFCFAQQSLAQSCSATVAVIQREGGWEQDNRQTHIYDVLVTNTHTSCAIHDAVSISLSLPPGSLVGQMWGMTTNMVDIYDALAPGQSQSGVGFILTGEGTPTITITGYSNCQCVGSIEPQRPTDPPTSPPTPSPSPSPTPTLTPTKTPTSSPSPSPTTSTPTPTPTPTPTSTPLPTNGTYYRLGLKFLILTCNLTDFRLTVAKNTLDAVGSQYDVVDQPSWGAADLSLTNLDGSGKYYAIVSTYELVCWSSVQQTTLQSYEKTFRVKTVILYSFPYATNGVSATIGYSITSSTAFLSFAPALQSSTQSLKYDAQIPISGVYAYQASIVDTMATPALYLNDGSTQYVVAAIIRYSDGRVRMEFYVDQGPWALYPVLLGSAWLQWASNGVFAGARRIELNCHMDDIFMNTGMFDLDTGEESESVTYRLTPADMEAIAAWQITLNAQLPPGSNFTLTFPFNGQTVIENGGYAVDALFLKALQLRDNFIWESHTWSHPYFDNYTYAQVTDEYVKNDDTAKQLFGANLSTFINYCSKSTITPSISGLFNPSALRAIHDHGYLFVVGDNSRKELIPANVYHSIHTSVAVHGYDGVIIIPRHATNIFYDCSRVSDIVTEYNYHYSKVLGGDRTFAQIIESEVNAAVFMLLAFRKDPFMFHQANLRFDTANYPDGKSHSLLSYWVESVIAELTKFTSLPIHSRKHDYLGQMFLDREARDSCGFQAVLKFDTVSNAIVGANVQASGTCTFGISGVSASGANVVNVEVYGSEQTLLLGMTPGTNFDVTFSQPVYQL